MAGETCAAAEHPTHAPKIRLPAGAVDTHFHVFGPVDRYPYAERRAYTPPDASFDCYRAMAGMLGIARAVIVHPSVYGMDNSRTLATPADADLPLRRIVVARPDITDGALASLHEQGARGIRINTVFSADAAFDDALALAARIRPLGWHIQFLTDVSTIPDLRQRVERLGIATVFDHFGHVNTRKGVGDPGFQALLGLVRDGLSWVKLSGSYRITGLHLPPYDDVAPFAQALVDANPSRLLWGSDWPHPSIPVAMPNDGALLDQMMDWVPDPALRQRIFVGNPEELYGFPPADASEVR